jgi:hypothetical protein
MKTECPEDFKTLSDKIVAIQKESVKCAKMENNAISIDMNCIKAVAKKHVPEKKFAKMISKCTDKKCSLYNELINERDSVVAKTMRKTMRKSRSRKSRTRKH